MPELVQQSTTQLALKFLMVQSSDHITGLTGASPTVTICKEGGSFASPAGAVSEIANGWYQVAGNATDTNTLGGILLHATAASGDPTDRVVAMVVGFNPQAALATPTNITAGTITTVTNLTNTANANVTQYGGHNIPATNVNGVPIVDLGYTLGTASAGAAGYIAPDLTLANYVETGVSVLAWLRAIGATAGGLLSGAGSGTETFNAMDQAAGTKARVVASVDSSGNRTAITYTFT